MTHCMTQHEKRELIEMIRDLTVADIIQQEDALEIIKIALNASNRVLASIDDPYPVDDRN